MYLFCVVVRVCVCDAAGKSSQFYRKQAQLHAEKRNAHFRAAAAAFKSGNSVWAGELAARGKQENKLMREAHMLAAAAALRENRVRDYSGRYAPSANGGGGKSTNAFRHERIDFHGLHVHESVRVLKEMVQEIRSRVPRQRAVLTMVTGVGLHSK